MKRVILSLGSGPVPIMILSDVNDGFVLPGPEDVTAIEAALSQHRRGVRSADRLAVDALCAVEESFKSLTGYIEQRETFSESYAVCARKNALDVVAKAVVEIHAAAERMRALQAERDELDKKQHWRVDEKELKQSRDDVRTCQEVYAAARALVRVMEPLRLGAHAAEFERLRKAVVDGVAPAISSGGTVPHPDGTTVAILVQHHQHSTVAQVADELSADGEPHSFADAVQLLFANGLVNYVFRREP